LTQTPHACPEFKRELIDAMTEEDPAKHLTIEEVTVLKKMSSSLLKSTMNMQSLTWQV